ncbi:conserved hypothetical protein [Paenibacillus curdlanolyticus YK9]|uniref:Uncharacterized protein n=1 Tax=Paenibacillus curdlanolyticus YK9 TaxID=717606 RepID=E0I711_9BACL|nr:hypothetical protein [Paenibacillus curdlanolyticus]EFM11827.1 conserved hypothetical protein [Paenibacillus curdlanolyticus YK9]
MEKLLLFVLMAVVWTTAQGQQMDEEMAMKALFQGKHAVNRAAHAAAQQIDMSELASGRIRIDPTEAEAEAQRYLQANLLLDDALAPLPNSFLRERVEVVVFEVVNGDRTFPYTYRNAAYEYEVTLEQPGVVLIIHLHYPRAFRAIEPIDWYVKGAAELVH